MRSYIVQCTRIQLIVTLRIDLEITSNSKIAQGTYEADLDLRMEHAVARSVRPAHNIGETNIKRWTEI